MMRLAGCGLALALLTAISAHYLLSPSKHIAVLIALECLLVLPPTLFALRHDQAGFKGVPAPPPVAVFAAFLVVTLPFSWIDSRSLLIPDEAAYQFQARTFSLGHLTAAAPPGAPAQIEDTPLPLYFEHHIIDRGRWFTKYPPGWPLLLAVAIRLGAGWLANPLLGLALLLLVALVATHLYGRTTASLAVLFGFLSPFFIANCVGRMSHPACGVLLAAACFFCFRGLHTRRLAAFVWMYLLIVLALQVRPLTAAVVGGTVATGALWYLRRDRIFARVLSVGVLFAALGVASLLAYNQLYTGSYRLSPYVLFNRNPLTRSGNMSDIDLNPFHMLSHLVHATRWAMQDTVYYAFPFVFLLAAYAVWREKAHPREVRILAVLFPALVLAHVIQPAVSAEFAGERYYFEAYFAVLILGARGLALLAAEHSVSRRTLAVMVFLFAVCEVGQQVLTARDFWTRTGPYRAVLAAAERLGTKRYTVFLRDAAPRFEAKHFNLNRPDWQNGSLFYLVDPGPSGRNVWACRVGRADWVVLTYDPAQLSGVAEEFGKADVCP